MNKKIYFIGIKRYSMQIVEDRLFKKPVEERVWCMYNEKAILACSEDEAIEKYKERYPITAFWLEDIAKSSDNFDWFRRRTKIDEGYAILNSTHSIDWLSKNMDCEDFKEWFFDGAKISKIEVST